MLSEEASLVPFLKFIKVGVKIECQEAKSQEQIEACKTPEASNHFSNKIELKKVE